MIDWMLAVVCAALAVAAIVTMIYFVVPILTTMVHYG